MLVRWENVSGVMAENSAVGTVTMVRFSVGMRVERNPISSTVPTRSPNRQKSPTATGRSVMTATPPKRFSTVFCAASAIARPPTPSPAKMVVVLYPQLLRMAAMVRRKIVIFRERETSGNAPMVKILEQPENQKAAMMEFRMQNGNHWARLLAYVTVLINQELLLQNEYLAAENRILRAHLPARLRLSDPERCTLAEIGKRLGRKALEKVACVAKPDSIIAWYRRLIAHKFDGSQVRTYPGPPRISAVVQELVVRFAPENS